MKRKILRILALLLTCSLLLGILSGCGGEASEKTETTGATEPAASEKAVEALDGKKIIFIGNSFTFHGYALFHQKELTLTQQERTGDAGYFYQLCKRAGAEITVTNWCFGGHNLSDIFFEPCTLNKDCKGTDHSTYLQDTNFDYVVIQPYVEKGYQGDLLAYLEPVLSIFRSSNPDVKFFLLVPHMACEENRPWIEGIGAAAEQGITVCNWGQMLHDIVQGKTQVPGAVQSYSRPTFVVSASEKDGYHQNVLAGYLTAVMMYSALTGESAVGQPYDFCNDATIDERFDFEAYKQKKYVYEPYTNFVEVFQSPADMKGLQQLVDQYLAEYNP